MRRHIAAAGTLMATLLVGFAPPATAADSTTITFRIPRCVDCLIAAYRVDPATKEVFNAEPVPVVGRRAQLMVPTDQTRGMVFTVTPPASWDVVTSQPLIAVAYKGRAPGDRNTSQGAGKASPCWAGTTKAKVTISLRSSGPGGLPGGASMPAFAFQTAGEALQPYLAQHDGGGIAREGYLSCRSS